MTALAHLEIVSLETLLNGFCVLMNSPVPCLNGFVLFKYSVNTVTIQSLLSGAYAFIVISFCWKPGLVVFKESPNRIFTWLFVTETFLMSTKCILCPLCPVSKSSSITVFCDSSRRLKAVTGDNFFRYFVTTSGSQVTLFLGRLGLWLKMPLSNLMITGCVPIGFPSHVMKVDKALLAVFIALYPKSDSYNDVKKLITVSSFGDMLSKPSSLQYCSHFLK